MAEVSGYNTPLEQETNDSNIININAMLESRIWNKTADRKKYDKEYNKKYYQERKQTDENFTCAICMGKYNKYSKEKHEQTKRHIYINNQKNNII